MTETFASGAGRGSAAEPVVRVRPAHATADRISIAAAWLIGGLGVSALAGWLFGQLLLASLLPMFIPMAPLTALAFIALAVAFLQLGRRDSGTLGATIAGALVCAVATARLISLISGRAAFPDVEATLVPDGGLFGVVPLARISPVTAAALAAAGAAVILLARRRPGWTADLGGWLGTALALTGGTVLLGYGYGTPLLYGGAVIPVALPTGIGLLLAGIAAIALAGLDASPLRAFTEGGARARLLRAFLPATTAAILLASAAGNVLVFGLHANPALAAAVSTLLGASLVAVLIWRIAGSVGHAIDRAEESLTRARDDLEAAVSARTAELARINEELDAFTSSVSHDLRAPLRHMTGFATLLERNCRDGLGESGRNHARQIVEAGGRMSRLIDDLLTFARTAQAPLHTVPIDLTVLVKEVIDETSHGLHGRVIEWHLDPLPPISGDRALMRQALANLVANAVKYTGTRDRARIQIGALPGSGGEQVIYVRDNGVGFDMAYAGKLFGVFQRLHGTDEFEGTGIGLANVRRIVQRHGGRTWAEGAVNQGATFFMSLPSQERTTA